MFNFVGSFCFIFVSYFYATKFCFFSCLSCVLPVASPPGEGTRQRPDGGARQTAIRPGVFLFNPSGFSFFAIRFFFFGAFFLLCLLLLLLSIYFLFLYLFVYLFILIFFSISFFYFSFRFVSCFFVFAFFSSFSVSGWLAHVCWIVIAQYNDIALYH